MFPMPPEFVQSPGNGDKKEGEATTGGLLQVGEQDCGFGIGRQERKCGSPTAWPTCFLGHCGQWVSRESFWVWVLRQNDGVVEEVQRVSAWPPRIRAERRSHSRRLSEDHLLPSSLAGLASTFLSSTSRSWQLRQRNKDIDFLKGHCQLIFTLYIFLFIVQNKYLQ